jgi:16S rRNA C1402 N4-methylase RsmH
LLLENTNCTVYAIDRDKSVFELNSDLIKKYPDRLKPLYGKFSDMEFLLKKAKYYYVSYLQYLLYDITKIIIIIELNFLSQV